MSKHSIYLVIIIISLLTGALLVKNNLKPSAPAPQEKIIREVSLEYHLLLADMAWQRNLWADAAANYILLAQATGRGDFALLATSAALEANHLRAASFAARLWANSDFSNSDAQALAAMLLIKGKNDQQALQHLTRLVEYTPNQALPHLMLLTKELKQPQEKQDFLLLLQELSMKYNNDPGIWFALARQAQQMKDYPLALAATDRCLSLEPSWVSAIALRVQLLYQTQEKLAAKEYLAHVLQQQPYQNDLQMIYAQIAKEVQ